MKKRFPEEQIIKAISRLKNGAKAKELARDQISRTIRVYRKLGLQLSKRPRRKKMLAVARVPFKHANLP